MPATREASWYRQFIEERLNWVILLPVPVQEILHVLFCACSSFQWDVLVQQIVKELLFSNRTSVFNLLLYLVFPPLCLISLLGLCEFFHLARKLEIPSLSFIHQIFPPCMIIPAMNIY